MAGSFTNSTGNVITKLRIPVLRDTIVVMGNFESVLVLHFGRITIDPLVSSVSYAGACKKL
jgi:hypothetical protein